MKYIKSFEKSLMDADVMKHIMDTYDNGDFNVGDYVVMRSDDNVGKILNIENFQGADMYSVQVFIIDNLVPVLLPVILWYENIKRLATPEEIEKFELKIQQQKYNL